MKRFVFRLESVLRIRAFELERARVQLAAMQAERTRRQAVVDEEAARVEKGRAVLDEEAAAGVDGERLALRADALASGRFRLAHAERALGDLDEPLAEARRRVHHARTRLRSLERLKEDAATRHRVEGLAAEQAELEELALSRIALEQVARDRRRDVDRRMEERGNPS